MDECKETVQWDTYWNRCNSKGGWVTGCCKVIKDPYKAISCHFLFVLIIPESSSTCSLWENENDSTFIYSRKERSSSRNRNGWWNIKAHCKVWRKSFKTEMPGPFEEVSWYSPLEGVQLIGRRKNRQRKIAPDITKKDSESIWMSKSKKSCSVGLGEG